MLFREVAHWQGFKGGLFLHSMLGRREPLANSLPEIESLSINGILSLASLDEIENKSPTYATAIKSHQLPCEYISFPIDDYNVPEDREKYSNFVKNVADRLRNGERLLMHCGAGIGRTGTVACCILIELGLSKEKAEKTVSEAGSHPENDLQKELVRWYAQTKLTGMTEE